MKAIQLEKPGSFRHIEIPEPKRPVPGEALVRAHCVGSCGTESSGDLGKSPFYSSPRIPGHGLGAETLKVGAEVSSVKAGDRWSVEPYMN